MGEDSLVTTQASSTGIPAPIAMSDVVEEGNVIDIRPYLGKLFAMKMDAADDRLPYESPLLAMPWAQWVAPECRGAVLCSLQQVSRGYTPAVRLFDFTVEEGGAFQFSDDFRLLFDRLELGIYIHWHQAPKPGVKSCTVYGFKQSCMFQLLKWLCEEDGAPTPLLKASVYGLAMGMDMDSIEDMLNDQCGEAIEGSI